MFRTLPAFIALGCTLVAALSSAFSQTVVDRANGSLTLLGGWDFNGVGTSTSAATLVARYNQQYSPYFASTLGPNGGAALQSRLHLTAASGVGATFNSNRAFNTANAPVYDLLSTDGITVSNNSLGDQGTSAARSLLLSTTSLLDNARAVFEIDTLTTLDRFESINLAYSARNQGGAEASISWSYSIDGGFTFVPITGTTASLSANQTSFSVYTASFAGLSAIEGRENILLGLEYSESAAAASVFIDNIAIYGTAAPLAIPPSISGLSDIAVVSGATATFTANVTEAGASPVFQWQKSPLDVELWTPVSGASTSTLSFASVTATDFARYRLVVTNPNNNTSTTSASVRLIEGIPPSIAIGGQPGDLTVNPGQDASFTIIAEGSSPLIYKWTFNGTPLVPSSTVLGTAGPVLTLVAADEAREGVYAVEITNDFGTITSAGAILTVTGGDVAPTIQSQPVALIALEGGSASFFVLASGTPEPEYQWFRDNVALSDVPGIAGSKTAELNLTNLSTAAAGSYTVRIFNAAGSVDSAAASLVVETIPKISIGGQPSALTVIQGGVASFTVVATGNPTPTYQWRRGTTPLAGPTGATLTLDPVAAADAGDYSVVVTNSRGSVTSSLARLTVITPPTISVPPAASSAFVGDNIALRVTAAGVPAPTYQWTKNGVPIPGATTTTLNLLGVTVADAGAYRVAVTNSAGSVTSAPATLAVGTRLSRSSGSTPQTIAPGSRLLMPTSVAGTGLRFQWYKNGRAIPGATTNTFEIPSVTGTDSGSYLLRVFGANGRILIQHSLGRIDVSRAADFRVLLRDATSAEAIGLVAIKVGANLAFTGTWTAENGRIYSLRGKFTEAGDSAQVTLTVPYATGDARSLGLTYHYQDQRLSITSARGTQLHGTGENFAKTASAPWQGRYNLTLSDAQTSTTLSAAIASSGVMNLRGRLADNTPVTASIPGGAGRDYAIWNRLYSGRGYLGGILRLVGNGSTYTANETTSGGRFSWFKPAIGANPIIDRSLAPALGATP